MKTFSGLRYVVFATFVAGCAVDAESPGEPTPAPEAASGKLTVAVDTPEQVLGTYQQGEETLTFDAKSLGGNKYEITLQLNGLTLTALGDAKTNYHDMDGFATANGGDSTLDELDRQLLTGFFQTYQEEMPRVNPSYLENQLKSTGGYWSSLPDGLPLQKSVMGTSDRDIVHLCSEYLAWHPSTHDCWHGGDWEAGQWAYTSIGERWDRGPGGYFEHHYYQDSPRWDNHPQAHRGGSYMAGKCLGRCWAGCDALGVNQRLTQDCANHDLCATGNHDLTSFWCQDEAVAAGDDGLLAGILCGGTGSDPQWVVDWEANGYPLQSP